MGLRAAERCPSGPGPASARPGPQKRYVHGDGPCHALYRGTGLARERTHLLQGRGGMLLLLCVLYVSDDRLRPGQ